MNATEMLAAGQLNSALNAAQLAVREDPMNYRHRTLFFTLLSFAGDFDRAEQQLQVLGQEDEEAAQGTAIYKQILQASRARAAVFRGDAPGHFMLNEPPYGAAQRQLIAHIATGDLDGAAAALAEVARLRPRCVMQTGDLVGSLRDADDRVAPFAELFVQGEYVWLPWEQVRSLRVPRPVHLRDLIWAPAVVELDAGPVRAFMPVLYPETSAAADELTRLGRITEWRDNPLGLSIGQGARMLLVEPAGADEDEPAQELPLLEVNLLLRANLTREDHEGGTPAGITMSVLQDGA